MKISEEIKTVLESKFKFEQLEVIDDSEKHHGHAGYQEGGQSHFRLIIDSSELKKLPRLARHRAINDALQNIHKKIHALEIKFL